MIKELQLQEDCMDLTNMRIAYLDIGEAPRYLRRMKNLVDSFLS